MTAIPIDPERVIAIVESTHPDNTGQNAPEVNVTSPITDTYPYLVSD